MTMNEGLHALLTHALNELYDADKQLLTAWPKLAEAATAESLVNLCREGGEYTEARIRRLDRAFDLLGEPARRAPCPAMKGLVRQALDTIADRSPEAVTDAAILAAVQKISTYGMAAYDIVHRYAQALHAREIVDLLAESLEEKKDAVVEEQGMAQDEFIPHVLKAEADSGRKNPRRRTRQSARRSGDKARPGTSGTRRSGI